MKANIRNDAPTAKVRDVDLPIARSRYSGFLSAATPAKSFAGAGHLMGMLALTYNKAQTVPSIPATFKSDEVPVVNIRNTD